MWKGLGNVVTMRSRVCHPEMARLRNSTGEWVGLPVYRVGEKGLNRLSI